MFSLFVIIYLLSATLIHEAAPLTPQEISLSIETNLKYESDSPNKFIIYRGFVVQFNDSKKLPNFTIHRLTLDQISIKHDTKARRRSNYFVDDNNLRFKSATNRDYKGSGYDRGHMVPAGDFFWNQLLKNETFVLTNISPQNPVLNRGIWAFLESAIRRIVKKNGHTAYVITGELYDDSNGKVIGPGMVSVPTYLYKLVFIPDEEIMFAFMFNNEVERYDSPLIDYQVRVDDIEKVAKEDFFDKLPDDIESRLESTLIPFK